MRRVRIPFDGEPSDPSVATCGSAHGHFSEGGVVPIAFDRNGAHATLRVIVEPLTPWIWAGGLIVVIGALVSVGGVKERQAAVVSARERRPAAAVPELGEVAS